MNLRRWLHEHSLKLLAIRDTPEAIAGGVAIGIFFGFTPLFGLKTLSAIFFAWLTGSNILAAVISGALHDVILPFMPIIYRWDVQCRVLAVKSSASLATLTGPHALGGCCLAALDDVLHGRKAVAGGWMRLRGSRIGARIFSGQGHCGAASTQKARPRGGCESR